MRTRLQVTADGARPDALCGTRRRVDTLRQTLAQAERGQGQVVALVGEAGVGKSRLVYEFKPHSRSHPGLAHPGQQLGLLRQGGRPTAGA